MGSYSQLEIGPFSLAWKYYVPSFVMFLFAEGDFYQDFDASIPADSSGDSDCQNSSVAAIGWRTTVRTALSNLNQSGFGESYFAMVYETLQSDLANSFEDAAKYRIREQLLPITDADIDRKVEQAFSDHLRSFPAVNPVEVAKDFVEFVRATHAASAASREGVRAAAFRSMDGKEYAVRPDLRELDGQVLADADVLEQFLFNRELEFPPWILMAATAMEYDSGLDRPEVFYLMMFWVLLEISQPDEVVRLDLADLEYTEQDVRSLSHRLRYELTRKVSLYSSSFQVLMNNEREVREAYTKLECAQALERSRSIGDANEKGRALEDAIEMLFRLGSGLVLQEKRVTTGDEEIDLVYRNNVNRPFWLNHQSPLLFVECKNWSANVGASEIRNFEGKLRNHRGARIGLMIAGVGFTTEVDNALRRQSREDFHITLISVDAILAFCRNDQSFFNWIESVMATLH